MDGYDVVMRINRERPDYLPIVKKCIAAHHKQKEASYSNGFEWSDLENVGASVLYSLATKYEFLKLEYKSNSATCYMVKDVENAEKALRDIEAGKIAIPTSEGGKALKIWLSAATMKKLKEYMAKEFPGQWDAEALTVERALNLFLDKSSS